MCVNKKCKQVSEMFMHDKAAAGSTESPVTSVCIIEDSREDPPALRSAGELGNSFFPILLIYAETQYLNHFLTYIMTLQLVLLRLP